MKTKINPWKVTNDKTRAGEALLSIKRWIVVEGKGTNERLPTPKYQHIRHDKTEMDDFVRRLNAEQFKDELAIEKILDRNAFLNPKLITEYADYLEIYITNPQKRSEEISTLHRHILNIFVGRFNLVNPKDWVENEDKWYKYLLSAEAPSSAYSKKWVIQVLNRFMRWLFKTRKSEMPLVQFAGLPDGVMRNIERNRIISGDTKERKDIPLENWTHIRKALDTKEWSSIKPWSLLCYHYGLRRAEAMGLLFKGNESIFTDGIELERQLDSYSDGNPTYGKLKSPGRNGIRRNRKQEKRFIPHWLDMEKTPDKACDWIEEGLKCMMHPDTFTHRWNNLMKHLGYDHDIHELRHTWITRCRAEGIADREVQLAAGHASIETTEGYSHDHRKLTRKQLRPKK